MLAYLALLVQTGLLACCGILIHELRAARFESKTRGERRIELAENGAEFALVLEEEARRARKALENGTEVPAR